MIQMVSLLLSLVAVSVDPAAAPRGYNLGPSLGGTNDNAGVSTSMPTLRRLETSEGRSAFKSLSGCCHILLFYGVGATDLSDIQSGSAALHALTDEESAISLFGKTPFIRTRHGLRYLLSSDPVFNTDVGESHRDQCLATFGALNLPLSTPISLRSGRLSIADLLKDSIATYTAGEAEPAWTTIAYTKYLPPVSTWTNRFQEKTSFSDVAARLARLDLNHQSCGGTHIFQALVEIERADHRHGILSEQARTLVRAYIDQRLQDAVRNQKVDGRWSRGWTSKSDESSDPSAVYDGILVTGHLLEILNSLPAERGDYSTARNQAARWLKRNLTSREVNFDGSFLCPFTHASRAASRVLETGTTAKDSLSITQSSVGDAETNNK